MRSLRVKILLLTLLPLLVVTAVISGVAIYNKVQTENQLLLDRLTSYRALLESGDWSFDTVQDKVKTKQLIGEEIVLAEILRSDYSVVYSSENSAAPLVAVNERPAIDEAFHGFETVTTERTNGVPVFSVITPLVVNGKIVAVLHQRLSNVESASRVAQTTAFVLLLMVFGLIMTFIPLYWLLSRIVINNISKLKEATIEIRKGNLGKAIEIRTNDEIGELATNFNLMTSQLKKSRESVERKVQELSHEHGKLSSLVESVRLGVVMVDLSLKVVQSNSAARAMFGRNDKPLSFKDVADKIKGKVDISQALSSYVKSGKPLNIQEVMIDDRYYRLFMSPVRDIVQKVFIGAVFVMEDITEQKKLDQMRSEIVSITSHQLRTPATIIKGNLEMVLDGDAGKISKEQKELLQDVYLGNERMIHLVNDLMDASKIDEGRFVLPAEPTDFEALVEEVIKEDMPFAVKRDVAVMFEKSAASLPKAKINRQKVKQVIQNLVDNAIKYSGVNGKGQVKVVVGKKDNFLQFSVKDNGIGIPAADRDRIFERFFRGSNSSRLDPGGGSGLGLYIAKGVVEQAGGKIWFDSKEGDGTTFYATFPTA